MAVAVQELDYSAASAVVRQYALDVVDGRQLANRYVRLAGERHLRDLEDGPARGLRFDEAAAGRSITFFSHLTLAEGDIAETKPRPFILRPWQSFIVGSCVGWMATDEEDGSEIRRFRNAYVETGKGSGKTPIGGGLGLFGVAGDTEAAPEVYSVGNTRDQSKIPWTDAKRMAEASPALRSRIEISAHALAVPSRNGTFQYLSSEARNLHGKRPHLVIVEEEHAHPDSSVIDAMRLGTKGRRNALIFRITNSGHDRHSICWQDHEYSVRILERILHDDAWFGFVCGLDMCDEHRSTGRPEDGCPRCDQWTDEAVWPKANPNLGVSIPVRYLRETVREAIGKPASQSIVKRLNFCIWTEGTGKWLDAARFVECGPPDPAPAPLPAGGNGWAGLDLSSTTDLTAWVAIVPRATCTIHAEAARCYDLRARFWLPADNLRHRVDHDHVPYDVWVRDGWISLTPGTRVDQERIVAEIAPLKNAVAVVGIDRWNTAWMTPALQAKGFVVIEVGQGFHDLSAPAKRLEADIAGGLVHHDGNPVLTWMVANAVATEDAAGNVKPDKEKSTERIDGVSAWCDALFAYSAAPQAPATARPGPAFASF